MDDVGDNWDMYVCGLISFDTPGYTHLYTFDILCMILHNGILTSYTRIIHLLNVLGSKQPSAMGLCHFKEMSSTRSRQDRHEPLTGLVSIAQR